MAVISVWMLSGDPLTALRVICVGPLRAQWICAPGGLVNSTFPDATELNSSHPGAGKGSSGWIGQGGRPATPEPPVAGTVVSWQRGVMLFQPSSSFSSTE